MSADHGTGVAGDSERYNGGVPLSERPSACANAVGPGNHDTMVRTANRVSGVAGINVSGPVEQAGQSASLPAMGSFRRNLMAAMIIFSNLMQMTVGFAGVGGGFQLGKLLGVDISTSTWIAASYG